MSASKFTDTQMHTGADMCLSIDSSLRKRWGDSLPTGSACITSMGLSRTIDQRICACLLPTKITLLFMLLCALSLESQCQSIQKPQSQSDGRQEKSKSLIVATGYCKCHLCCGAHASRITASGARPVEGITCAASRSIPFGTVLTIEGVGRRTVQDRLAIRYDARLDVYFERHSDAVRFGKRKLKVTR